MTDPERLAFLYGFPPEPSWWDRHHWKVAALAVALALATALYGRELAAWMVNLRNPRTEAEMLVASSLTANSDAHSGFRDERGLALCLNAKPNDSQDPTMQTHCIQHAQIGRKDEAGPQGRGYREDMSFTLDSTSEADADADAVAYAWQSGGDVRHCFGKPSLHSGQVPAVGVRRLMPVECERLQGFPDGWTEGFPDSVRYRMIGNAVAVPVAEWIGRRLLCAR